MGLRLISSEGLSPGLSCPVMQRCCAHRVSGSVQDALRPMWEWGPRV